MVDVIPIWNSPMEDFKKSNRRGANEIYKTEGTIWLITLGGWTQGINLLHQWPNSFLFFTLEWKLCSQRIFKLRYVLNHIKQKTSVNKKIVYVWEGFDGSKIKTDSKIQKI
jgi:hypothetical protein